MAAWQSAAGDGSIHLAAIHQAEQRLASYCVQTPVLQSDYLNKLTGGNFYFKCENLQHTGSFKFRGACYALLQLTAEQQAAGVYTVSSGNHGAALAYAGQLLNIPVHVAVPSTAPAVKKANIARYGAHITELAPGMEARAEFLARQETEQPTQTFVPPYNHPNIIIGQGTAALELIKEVPNLDTLMTPVGGGGLAAGTCMVGNSQNMQVFAAEPEHADDAWASLQSGKIEPSRGLVSICDGLLTQLGELTFPILQDKLTAILKVSDDAVIEAMQLLWQELKIIVEPSSATVFAAALTYPEHFAGKFNGLILSGGNLDIHTLPWPTNILERPYDT